MSPLSCFLSFFLSFFDFLFLSFFGIIFQRRGSASVRRHITPVQRARISQREIQLPLDLNARLSFLPSCRVNTLNQDPQRRRIQLRHTRHHRSPNCATVGHRPYPLPRANTLQRHRHDAAQIIRGTIRCRYPRALLAFRPSTGSHRGIGQEAHPARRQRSDRRLISHNSGRKSRKSIHRVGLVNTRRVETTVVPRYPFERVQRTFRRHLLFHPSFPHQDGLGRIPFSRTILVIPSIPHALCHAQQVLKAKPTQTSMISATTATAKPTAE